MGRGYEYRKHMKQRRYLRMLNVIDESNVYYIRPIRLYRKETPSSNSIYFLYNYRKYYKYEYSGKTHYKEWYIPWKHKHGLSRIKSKCLLIKEINDEIREEYYILNKIK